MKAMIFLYTIQWSPMKVILSLHSIIQSPKGLLSTEYFLLLRNRVNPWKVFPGATWQIPSCHSSPTHGLHCFHISSSCDCLWLPVTACDCLWLALTVAASAAINPGCNPLLSSPPQVTQSHSTALYQLTAWDYTSYNMHCTIFESCIVKMTLYCICHYPVQQCSLFGSTVHFITVQYSAVQCTALQWTGDTSVADLNSGGRVTGGRNSCVWPLGHWKVTHWKVLATRSQVMQLSYQSLGVLKLSVRVKVWCHATLKSLTYLI